MSHFGFEDRILTLIVPVPDQCLLFTFIFKSFDITFKLIKKTNDIWGLIVAFIEEA